MCRKRASGSVHGALGQHMPAHPEHMPAHAILTPEASSKAQGSQHGCCLTSRVLKEFTRLDTVAPVCSRPRQATVNLLCCSSLRRVWCARRNLEKALPSDVKASSNNSK